MSDPATAEVDAEGVAGEDSSAGDWTPQLLRSVREDPHRRHAALVAAAMVGLALSWVHWLGLFVAGALVGLASESLAKALASGFAVGVLVLLVHVGASPVMSAGEFVGLVPASYVTLAAALVAPLWGSLVRGIV